GQGIAVLQRAADGSYTELWRRPTLVGLKDIVLADLDGDGVPEIVVASEAPGTPPQVRITAYRPDGSTTWEQQFNGLGECVGSPPQALQGTLATLGIGDVNGDGVADIVYQDADLHVLSGRDGSELWRVTINQTDVNSCAWSSVVLDVNGDGINEI